MGSESDITHQDWPPDLCYMEEQLSKFNLAIFVLMNITSQWSVEDNVITLLYPHFVTILLKAYIDARLAGYCDEMEDSTQFDLVNVISYNIFMCKVWDPGQNWTTILSWVQNPHEKVLTSGSQEVK